MTYQHRISFLKYLGMYYCRLRCSRNLKTSEMVLYYIYHEPESNWNYLICKFDIFLGQIIQEITWWLMNLETIWIVPKSLHHMPEVHQVDRGRSCNDFPSYPSFFIDFQKSRNSSLVWLKSLVFCFLEVLIALIDFENLYFTRPLYT